MCVCVCEVAVVVAVVVTKQFLTETILEEMREMEENQNYFPASVIVWGHAPGSDRAYVLGSFSPIWDWHGDLGWGWAGGGEGKRQIILRKETPGVDNFFD